MKIQKRVRVFVRCVLVFSFVSGCSSSTEPVKPESVAQSPAARTGGACRLEIDKLEVKVGPNFYTNCYVVSDPAAKQAVVIDPGAEPRRIWKHLSDHGLALTGIALTHAHPDHTGGADELQKLSRAPVYLHPDQLRNAAEFEAPLDNLTIAEVGEGSEVNVGCSTLACFHTPGHSPGSLTFYSREASTAFTGDLLFAGAVGRTDIPGGDSGEIARQVKRITTGLPGQTRVLPGHGRQTTIATEKTNNPFIQSKEL